MNELFFLIWFFSIIILGVGLVEPTALSSVIKGEITRKKIGTIFGIVIIASFVLMKVTMPSSKNNEVTRQPSVKNTQTVTENKNDNSGANRNEQAVKKAKMYVEYFDFSRDGLIVELEHFEKFSHDDAVYGADNSGADWNEQAVKAAKVLMEDSAFSRGRLIAQLERDQFTQAQAEYGANAVGR